MLTVWIIWISFNFRYLIALVFSNLNGTETQKITMADCGFFFFLYLIGITHNLHFHLDLSASDSQSPDYFFYFFTFLCGDTLWCFVLANSLAFLLKISFSGFMGCYFSCFNFSLHLENTDNFPVCLGVQIYECTFAVHT